MNRWEDKLANAFSLLFFEPSPPGHIFRFTHSPFVPPSVHTYRHHKCSVVLLTDATRREFDVDGLEGISSR